MISLLTKIFIKNRKDIKNIYVRSKYGMLCGIVGIILNIILFVFKFSVGVISSSVAIQSDAFNNLSDASSSIITIVGFKMSIKKPDKNHPFGHGRIEYVSGLIVSMIIVLMGFQLTLSSINKIINPSKLIFNPIIIVILVSSIIVKIYMFYYNSRIGKLIESKTMEATAKDSFSDVIATTVVLIATCLAPFTKLNLDGWCGLFVALFIIWSGIQAAKETISPLLGQPATKEFVERIESIVKSHGVITGVHDIIVHNYGPGRIIVSLHAEIPADINLILAHDEIDNIEKELNEKLECASVIHMDPIDLREDNRCYFLKFTKTILNEISEELNFHDFRVVTGPTHSNIIFDLVVPYEFKIKDEELKKIIINKFLQKNKNYNVKINIDKPYTK